MSEEQQQRRRSVRLPTRADIDPKTGLVRMQLTVKAPGSGTRQVVRHLAPVDAREHIYSGSGQLDIDPEIKSEDAEKTHKQAILEGMGIDALRDLCSKNKISFTGHPPSVLRRVLLQADVVVEEADDVAGEEHE